jgi:hypothetical protein
MIRKAFRLRHNDITNLNTDTFIKKDNQENTVIAEGAY